MALPLTVCRSAQIIYRLIKSRNNNIPYIPQSPQNFLRSNRRDPRRARDIRHGDLRCETPARYRSHAVVVLLHPARGDRDPELRGGHLAAAQQDRDGLLQVQREIQLLTLRIGYLVDG